ncbi:hypothetical protein CXG81DRAFT_28340 [Caulochytrium protostelioides]|uniref:Uncharacterized protein n=1 Tax=Caulochytrium protostelioides TaxID=1555241 RepID=A0A4P9X1N2_9FUNG|nr:hypothetical protein CXG81DRAFT_28340 [Caulochytrium protostelioides]|eukprot:RKO98863.1 hypothetical protein CXG81DRAFT_28340 [Caulochytrium protostelioides]
MAAIATATPSAPHSPHPHRAHDLHAAHDPAGLRAAPSAAPGADAPAPASTDGVHDTAPRDVNAAAASQRTTDALLQTTEIALTWDQAAHAVAAGQWERLSRTPAELVRYARWLETTLATWASVADYMRSEVYGAASAVDPASGRRVVTPAAMAAPNVPRTVLRRNDFPYALAPGIGHWVVWSQEPLDRERTEAAAAARFPDVPRMVFENPGNRKSIAALYHWHVFLAFDARDARG